MRAYTNDSKYRHRTHLTRTQYTTLAFHVIHSQEILIEITLY